MHQPRIAVVGFVTGIAAMCASVVFCPSTARAQQPVAMAAASKIGVVNFQDVYVKMKETLKTKDTITGLQEELEVKQKSHHDQMANMQQQIATQTKPGTKDRDQKLDEADQKMIEFQLEEQGIKVQMARTQARQLKQAYDEIKMACTDIAKKRGFDLVIVSSGDLPENIAEGTPEQIGNAVFSRNVMYASDSADITSQVLLAVDAAYAAKGPPAAPAAPAHP